MATPTRHDVHVDAILSNVAVAYRNMDYIMANLAPWVKVNKLSDKYFIFGKESFRVENTSLRAFGKPAREVDYTLSSDSYSCNAHAFKHFIPKDIEDNADTPLNLQTAATRFLTDKLQLAIEYAGAASLFVTGTYTNKVTLAGTAQWSDAANSNPFDDVETAIDTIQKAVGKKPNKMAMGYAVYKIIRNHPDVLDRTKYVSKESITPETLAAAFGVEQVLVGRAIYDSAVEGQTASLGYVWGKNVLLGYVESSPSIESPTLAYTFGTQPVQIRKWWNEDRKATAIEAEAIYHAKVVDEKAGYLIINAVA